MPPSNPYRIPKPKQDILWRGTLRRANERGKSQLGCTDIYNALLTSTHLWLWDELAIPLTTITKITSLNQGGGAGIYFHQALIDQDLIAHVRMMNFFHFPDRKRMAVFTTLLLKARENTLAQAPGQGSIHAVAETLRSEAKCEKCGAPTQRYWPSAGYSPSVSFPSSGCNAGTLCGPTSAENTPSAAPAGITSSPPSLVG